MKFTQMAALIAGLTLVISSVQVSAQTEVPSAGVVIVNTNSNDNKNDSEAAAASESDVAQEISVQAQPTTIVESSPAINGRAESLRSARKDEEVNTESKIVEKLEASRLEDERRRADALFGDRFESMNKKVEVEKVEIGEVNVNKNSNNTVKDSNVVVAEEAVVAPVVAAPIIATPVIVAPAPIVEVAPVFEKTYAGVTAGSTEYNASNVETQYAIGAFVGKQLDANWSVEGRFTYSNYYVNTFWIAPLFKELDQYDFGLTTRYSFAIGKVRPFVGAGLSYSYRSYQDRIYDNLIQINTDEATTHAVDGSLLAGLDFEISRNFSIGAEAIYTANVFVKNDEPVFASQYAQPYAGSKPLEEIDRTSLMVNAKFAF